MLKNHQDATINAENRLLGDVDSVDIFTTQSAGIELSEEDESLSIHRDLHALTRSTQPTANLVCLLRNGNGRLKTLDGLLDIDMKCTPKDATLIAALRSAVKIGQSAVLRYFMSQTVPASWKKSPHLRYAFPLEFEGDVCTLQQGLSLKLDKQLGVIILKD